MFAGRHWWLAGPEPEYRKVIEQFHLFAVGVQSWAAENHKRVFMLTSALSGEGKSFMAINLAASLARIGNRVVLIDADLRSPTLHRAFNIAPMRGLLSYLTEEADFHSCLQSTQIPGLLLVPADGTSYTPTEALARPRMREFVREARSLAPPHFVIIDAPAAAAVPESQILNGLIDAIVVVVAANRTPRALVKQTIDKAAGTPIYGIALIASSCPIRQSEATILKNIRAVSEFPLAPSSATQTIDEFSLLHAVHEPFP